MYGDNYVDLETSDGWFVRLWRRYRPAMGWGVFLLALTAAILLPAALVGGELIPGLGPAVSLSVIAFVFAWWLAQRPISGPWAAAVIAATGLAADLLWGVYVLRPLPLIPQFVTWWRWALGERATPEPVVTFFREQGALLGAYFERVAIWVRGLILGPGAPDNLATIGVIVFIVWLVAAWAAWWVARRREPFVAMLPAGFFLAQHAYWAPDTISYALIFLSVTVFLIVMSRLAVETRAWDASGVDYAEDIRLDVILTGLALTLVVTFASPALPFFASAEFSQKFWSLFESPWRRLEDQVSASFEVTMPVRSLVPPAGAEPGGLPRAHLLGGRPELGEQVALRVRIRGNPNNVLLYWRGQTYAEYTGRGWESGVGDPDIQPLQAGQPWGAELPSTEGRRPILASVEAVEATRAVLYAPGEPVSVDRPYRAILRDADDLVALTSTGGISNYTALSHVPEQDAARLRAAGVDYPSSVISRHLQLPENLDPQLVQLAESLTAGTQTPYDAAVAIEQGLRGIPYSLDLPTPPEGRELVSWFLFDLQRGYCDYYASAMVVLARLNGIPARLAIGYATGDFEERTGEYVVTELNAHSWPELFFPGVGWVPFEPTAYQPQPQRVESELTPAPSAAIPSGPADLESGIAELQASAQANAVTERREAATRGARVAALGLALLWAIWLMTVTTQPASSENYAVRAFGRFAGWGRRLGRPIGPGETPREYAVGLAGTAELVSRQSRFAKEAARSAAAVVRAEGADLAGEVERSLYAPRPHVTPAVRSWSALLAALRRLWIMRRFGGRKANAGDRDENRKAKI